MGNGRRTALLARYSYAYSPLNIYESLSCIGTWLDIKRRVCQVTRLAQEVVVSLAHGDLEAGPGRGIPTCEWKDLGSIRRVLDLRRRSRGTGTTFREDDIPS